MSLFRILPQTPLQGSTIWHSCVKTPPDIWKLSCNSFEIVQHWLRSVCCNAAKLLLQISKFDFYRRSEKFGLVCIQAHLLVKLNCSITHKCIILQKYWNTSWYISFQCTLCMMLKHFPSSESHTIFFRITHTVVYHICLELSKNFISVLFSHSDPSLCWLFLRIHLFKFSLEFTFASFP